MSRERKKKISFIYNLFIEEANRSSSEQITYSIDTIVVNSSDLADRLLIPLVIKILRIFSSSLYQKDILSIGKANSFTTHNPNDNFTLYIVSYRENDMRQCVFT